MKVYVETDTDSIKEELKADSRGRITLGSDYAGEVVSVAILEDGDDDE